MKKKSGRNENQKKSPFVYRESMRESDPPVELAALCRAEHPRLVGMLSLYCGNHDVAEEIAQETLVRACRDWEKVRNMDNPAAWLHRVGINLTNSVFRRRAAERRAKARLATERQSHYPTPSDAELLDALKDLPPRARAALLLRHHLGFSTRETAEAMDCPEGTVKTLLHKAIRELRASGALTGEMEHHHAE